MICFLSADGIELGMAICPKSIYMGHLPFDFMTVHDHFVFFIPPTFLTSPYSYAVRILVHLRRHSTLTPIQKGFLKIFGIRKHALLFGCSTRGFPISSSWLLRPVLEFQLHMTMTQTAWLYLM